MQHEWLDRQVEELRHEVIVARHFVIERFSGAKRRDALFDQRLERLGAITGPRGFASGTLLDAGRRGVVG